MLIIPGEINERDVAKRARIRASMSAGQPTPRLLSSSALSMFASSACRAQTHAGYATQAIKSLQSEVCELARLLGNLPSAHSTCASRLACVSCRSWPRASYPCWMVKQPTLFCAGSTWARQPTEQTTKAEAPTGADLRCRASGHSVETQGDDMCSKRCSVLASLAHV